MLTFHPAKDLIYCSADTLSFFSLLLSSSSLLLLFFFSSSLTIIFITMEVERDCMICYLPFAENPTVPFSCCRLQSMCRGCFIGHDASARQRSVDLQCPNCRDTEFFPLQTRFIVDPPVLAPANPVLQQINMDRAAGITQQREGLLLITTLQQALATFNAGWAQINSPVGETIRVPANSTSDPMVLQGWQLREERYVKREIFNTRDRYLAIEQELVRVRAAFNEACERGAFLLVLRRRREAL